MNDGPTKPNTTVTQDITIMSSKFTLDDEFGTPSKIPANPDDIDLSSFGQSAADTTAGAQNLRMKSLYRKFDPLVDNPSPASTPGAPGGGQMSLIDRAQKLLQRKAQEERKTEGASPTSAPSYSSTGDRVYTEAENQEAIHDAVSQAEEEAMIVQMETEDLRSQLAAEREQNAQMTAVMEEYSTEITKLMESKAAESENAEAAQLKLEKDQIEQDLEKTETAFADLHEKYMKAKEIVENYKKNEIVLKDAVQKGQLAINVAESRYNKLRSHAEEKIEEANKEIASVREQFQTQTNAVEMKIKTAEQEAKSAKRDLAAKIQDNAELTAICDELVKKLEGR